jgi:SAM-dependent methyltransferase
VRTELGDRLRSILRFACQPGRRFAVVSEGDPDLLELGLHTGMHFPQTPSGVYSGPYPPNGREAVSQLEDVRARGAQLLLIPQPSMWWLDVYTELRDHLAQNYEVALYEPDTCIAFSLHERLDDELRRRGAPDGIPLPPRELVCIAIGSYDAAAFLGFGERGADGIRKVMAKNGFELGSFKAILDFGCGAGRIMRNWHTLDGPELFGVDYNPYLVAWCRSNLRFATFEQSALVGSLPFPDGRFDFIYALSVFTHFGPEHQEFWIEELTRVLAPGGVLLLTLHGEQFASQLPTKERRIFESGEMVVLREDLVGTNSCAAFHPEAFVRDRMAPMLDLIDYVPQGAVETEEQDQVLFRKPL